MAVNMIVKSTLDCVGFFLVHVDTGDMMSEVVLTRRQLEDLQARVRDALAEDDHNRHLRC